MSRTGITLNRRRTLLDGEPGNGLRLLIVKKLKVFFFQVADRVALAIADEHRNQDHLYVAFNREGAILIRGFFLPCRQVRAQEESQAVHDDTGKYLALVLMGLFYARRASNPDWTKGWR